VSLTAAAISAWFGYRVAPDGQPELRSALSGVLTSLVIATPILLFLLKGERAGPLRRLRRLPLALYFAAKVLFYFVVIVGGLMVSRYFFWLDNPPEFFAFDGVFRRSIVFSVAMAVVGALAAEMSGLLGFGTLKNLLIGRYVQPRRERRAFLLIDMKDSTGVAERLGPVRFHELLNDFFHDVADAALECEAEIHKYVGDEAILTWPEAAATDGDCLRFPFLAQEVVERRRKTYLSRFGADLSRGHPFRRDRRRRDRRRAARNSLCRRHAECRRAPAGGRQGARPRRAGLRRPAGPGRAAGRAENRAATDPHRAGPRPTARDISTRALLNRLMRTAPPCMRLRRAPFPHSGSPARRRPSLYRSMSSARR